MDAPADGARGAQERLVARRLPTGFEADRADLDHLVALGVEAGRLDVEHDERAPRDAVDRHGERVLAPQRRGAHEVGDPQARGPALGAQPPEAHVAEPPRGAQQRPLGGAAVVGPQREPQQGQRVLDLLAPEELDSSTVRRDARARGAPRRRERSCVRLSTPIRAGPGFPAPPAAPAIQAPRQRRRGRGR